MTGLLDYAPERGKLRPEQIRMAGIPLLAATLYELPGLSGRRLERRLDRLERTMLNAGAGRVVTAPGFPYAGRLKRLKPLDPTAFLQALADALALGWLEVHEIPPERARVTLAGPRLSPALRECGERLSGRVQALQIAVPGEGERFAGMLRSRWGMPVVPLGAQTDLTIAFGPDTRANLQLTDPTGLGGLCLKSRSHVLPPGLEVPFLTLLWERGELKRDDLLLLKG